VTRLATWNSVNSPEKNRCSGLMRNYCGTGNENLALIKIQLSMLSDLRNQTLAVRMPEELLEAATRLCCNVRNQYIVCCHPTNEKKDGRKTRTTLKARLFSDAGYYAPSGLSKPPTAGHCNACAAGNLGCRSRLAQGARE
jgi:hypothetical protein